MRLEHCQKGLGLIGWIFMIPVILIGLLVLVFAYCELNKAYWDHKVKQWCEKDGGVKVYESVTLPREKIGKIFIAPEKKLIADRGEFFISDELLIIKNGDPEVRKYLSKLYRISDSKLLATRISYSRVGGDFPTVIGHETTFSCFNVKINNDIYTAVFQFQD